MSDWRRGKRLLLLLALGAFAGCSRLTIRTEIHSGQGLLRPPTPAEAARGLARQVERASRSFAGADLEALAGELVARAEDLQRAVPGVFAGDKDALERSAKQALEAGIEAPLAGQVAELAARAVSLEERAGAAPPERGPEFLREAQALHADAARLVRQAEGKAEEMVQRQADQAEQAINLRYPMKQLKPVLEAKTPEERAKLDKVEESDALLQELREATGLPLAEESQLAPALRMLIERARARAGALYASLGQELTRPLTRLAAAALPGIDFPLGDPNLARVVGDEDAQHWKQYVNDVSATTLLGETEVVVRMQDVGQYHIKRVHADPSDVMRATMSTTSLALKVVAASYGVPAPVGAPKPAPQGASLVEIQAEMARIKRTRGVRLAHEGALFDQLVVLAGKLRDATGNPVPSAVDLKAEAGALLRKYAAGIESGEVVE